MEFRDNLNYYFRNGKTEKTPATFKIAKPDMLLNNLEDKKMRVQKFYINNTATPIFIPERVTSDSYYNIQTDAPLSASTGDTLTATSLQYYVALRDVANTHLEVVYLQQPSINFGVPVPPSPIYDDFTYYINEFYYYYDFTHFLSLIVQALNTAYTNHPAASVNDIQPILWQNKQGFFQFFIANEPDW